MTGKPRGRRRPQTPLSEGYTPLRLTDCARCPAMVLTALVAGLRCHVDTRTVPRSHAAVLWRYGVGVVGVIRGQSGVSIDFWHPQDAANRPILAPHVCGAPANWKVTR